jgi:hypothetical protein
MMRLLDSVVPQMLGRAIRGVTAPVWLIVVALLVPASRAPVSASGAGESRAISASDQASQMRR